MPIPRARHLALVATAAALALALSACSADAEPTPSASPAPTEAAPIFASDEEALAAAVAAYDRYLDVTQQIGEDGGANAERILEVATQDYANQEIPNYESLAQHEYRVVGRGTIDAPRLMERSGSVVRIYGCVGVGTTRVLDASGVDITSSERPTTIPLQLSFEAKNDTLLVADSDVWSGDDFC
ncbi:hypothetical protein [Agromyces allii]|uniref:NTF2-like N-terminal transpeptidase domain-containing protein n=1 Tax=Agromyces allii TaxID=393607 RepID=A0ABP5BC01_9MICO|nr:hypothetical protein [Agromyces allii]